MGKTSIFFMWFLNCILPLLLSSSRMEYQHQPSQLGSCMCDLSLVRLRQPSESSVGEEKSDKKQMISDRSSYQISGNGSSPQNGVEKSTELVEVAESKLRNTTCSFSVFLYDYKKQLEECISLTKKDDQLFTLFSKKRVNVYKLKLLCRVASELEGMWNIVSDKNGKNQLKQISELNSRVKKLEKIKEDIFYTKLELDLTDRYEESVISTIKFFLTYLLFKMPNKHVCEPKNHIFLDHTFLGVLLVTFLFAIIYDGLTALLASSKKDIGIATLHFINDVCDLSTNILLYRFKNPLYRLMVLPLLPVPYLVCQYTISPFYEADHDAYIRFLEDKKNVLVHFSKSEQRIKLFSTIFHEKVMELPTDLFKIIISFLEESYAIQQIYPERVHKIKTLYYKEIAKLATTRDNYLRKDLYLNFCKGLNLIFLAMVVGLGVIYCRQSIKDLL